MDAPVEISAPDKLVYSAGLRSGNLRASLVFRTRLSRESRRIWDEHFGFVMNDGIGHLYLGEFGIKEVDGSGGRANLWFERLLSYMGTSYHGLLWSLNPNLAIPAAS